MPEFDFRKAEHGDRLNSVYPGDPISGYWGPGSMDIKTAMLLDEVRLAEAGLDPFADWPQNVYETLEAAAAMGELFAPTPLVQAPHLSNEVGATCFYKREDTTPVRSFKLRGAFNKIRQLSDNEKEAGVLAASAGNHAQGVALSAARLGISATIVMPESTPAIKVEAVKEYGAKVVLHGDNYNEAYEFSRQMPTDATYVHPFDDPEVITGQATIAEELLEQNPNVTHIFVPVGGGGLISGIAQYAKAVNPDIKIIGVQPEDSNAMQASVKAGRLVTLPHVVSFSDGVAVTRVGDLTFELTRRLVDDIITVNNDQIAAAMETFHRDTRATLEGAGALSIAGAKLYAANGLLNKNHVVATICSGANMPFRSLQYMAERNEIGSNREALFAIALPEVPGALRKLCQGVVNGHNITEFNYRRGDREQAHILVGFSMNGEADKQSFTDKLHNSGYEYVDLSADEFAKEHVRHMIGGASTGIENEKLYHIEFPEKPGALQDFLESLQDRWSITLFHYRSLGGDTGRVLIGFENPDVAELESLLSKAAQEFKPVTSPAANLFL